MFGALLVADFDQEACREPISSVFRYVFDENRDGMLEESELAIVYGTDTYDPCMKEFFNECTKGKESLTEKEFCSCFSAVGRILSVSFLFSLVY